MKVRRCITIDSELDAWLRSKKINISKECEEYLRSLSSISEEEYNEFVRKREILRIRKRIKELQMRLAVLEGRDTNENRA